MLPITVYIISLSLDIYQLIMPRWNQYNLWKSECQALGLCLSAWVWVMALLQIQSSRLWLQRAVRKLCGILGSWLQFGTVLTSTGICRLGQWTENWFSLLLSLSYLFLSLCLLPTCQNASNKIKFRGDRCWELVETRFQREEAKDSSPRVHAASSASLEVFSSSPW